MWRLFAVMFLAGCHAAPDAPRCPGFAETAVLDEVGSPAAEDQARAALEDFSGWTTREGACVSEVVVTEDVPSGAAGMLEDGRILVLPADWPGTRETTIHELCHAWDGAEGNPSHARTDLFEPENVPESELYPTVEARTEEAFARLCDDGPTAVAEDQLVATLCGDPSVLGSDAAWVQQHVYDAFVDELGADVEFATMTFTRTPLWADGSWGSGVSAAVAGDALVLLRVEWGETGAAVARLRHVDLATRTVTELPIPEEADLNHLGLLSTDGDPILWSARPPLVWRLDPIGGGATPLRIEGVASAVYLQGHAHADTAWVVPFGALGAEAPLTVDLMTGRTQALTAPDGAEIEGEARIFGNGDRVSLNVGGTVYTWSFTDASWSVTTPPALLTDYGLPLDGGTLAARYGFRRGDDAMYVPVLVDADTLGVTMPAEPCDTIGWEDGSPLLPVGDVLYVVTTGADGTSTDLLRIEP